MERGAWSVVMPDLSGDWPRTVFHRIKYILLYYIYVHVGDFRMSEKTHVAGFDNSHAA